MKILLLGPHGQVGRALREHLQDYDLVPLDRETGGDLADLDGLHRTLVQHHPQVIINAAAYTAVDRAEREAEQARLINAEAPRVMAEAARHLQARLIHYSSDYVFDGSGTRPWREDDPTGPLNVYGESKLAGEHAIRAIWENHLILRVSWVHHPQGRNFIRSILKLAQERERLRIVADQHGAPTPACLIARVTRELLARPEIRGTYHLAPRGETTWHGIACRVVRRATERGLPLRLDTDAIDPIPSEAYPTPAPRPKNSRLDTRALQALIPWPLPPWEAGVDDTVEALLKQPHQPHGNPIP